MNTSIEPFLLLFVAAVRLCIGFEWEGAGVFKGKNRLEQAYFLYILAKIRDIFLEEIANSGKIDKILS
jgi:hypothetical protein